MTKTRNIPLQMRRKHGLAKSRYNGGKGKLKRWRRVCFEDGQTHTYRKFM